MTFEPVRGGTRGGQAEFKWSDVSQDKDRENYLGHSINAPTGRWQKNKDIHWYNRDVKTEEAERLEEIRKIKEAEAEALAAALGFGSTKPSVPGAVVSGSNAVPVSVTDGTKEKTESATEKEERRRLRKAEKRAKKEEKRVRRRRALSEDSDRRSVPRNRSRSRSPVRRREGDYRRRSRSRSRTSMRRGEYDERPRPRDRR